MNLQTFQHDPVEFMFNSEHSKVNDALTRHISTYREMILSTKKTKKIKHQKLTQHKEGNSFTLQRKKNNTEFNVAKD